MAVEYKECYIAFLDILGFKNKIGKDDVKSIYSIFEKIQKHPFSEISKSEKIRKVLSQGLKIRSLRKTSSP